MDNQLTTVMEALKALCEAYPTSSSSSSSATFAELYVDYLKSIAGKGSSRAFTDKVRLSKHIIEDIGHYELPSLTIDVISRYINSWTTRIYIRCGVENLYSQSHIDKVYNNINCVLRYGVDKVLLTRNVMANLPCPISRRYTEDTAKALEEWEIQKVLQLGICSSEDISKAYWHTLKVLLLYTGVRPGEAFAFCFTDFDYSYNTVKVCRALSLDVRIDNDTLSRCSSQPYIKLLKNEVNGRREYARRKLSVGEYVINTVLWYKSLLEANTELLRLRLKHKTSNYLFAWHTDGQLKRPDYYCNAWRQHLIEHDIDPTQYNMYRFRHTFCTRLFKIHKLDPKTVQLLMGDNSMDMVMRVYHSVNKDDLLVASSDYSRQLDSSIAQQMLFPRL